MYRMRYLIHILIQNTSKCIHHKASKSLFRYLGWFWKFKPKGSVSSLLTRSVHYRYFYWHFLDNYTVMIQFSLTRERTQLEEQISGTILCTYSSYFNYVTSSVLCSWDLDHCHTYWQYSSILSYQVQQNVYELDVV